MRFLRTVCLVSLGGLFESLHELRANSPNSSEVWAAIAAVTACGWAWAAVGSAVREGYRRLLYALAGKPLPMPETDPKALAAEIRALNAQISQLRDTATSFDVSFDQTLERMNDRLARLEQQSAYVHVGRQV